MNLELNPLRESLHGVTFPRAPGSHGVPAGGSVSQVLCRDGPMSEPLIACYAGQLLEVAMGMKIFGATVKSVNVSLYSLSIIDDL